MTGMPAPAERIRLVISDIDGTLVTHAKLLTSATKHAILRLQELGIGFTVVSARPPVGLRSIIDALGLEVPVAAVNGGAIVRPDLTIIEETFLGPDAARLSIRLLREQGIDAWLFTPEAWFIRDPAGDHVDHEARTIGQPPTVVEGFDAVDVARVLKIVGASHDHPRLAHCEGILQSALGGTALATRSQVYYLDVTHPKANKGEAVASLARVLDVPASAILTIGDGANDVPMFGRSGFSVAMGNASDAVKMAATTVTEDCEHDGFARAIARYVLTEPGRLSAPSSAA